LLVGLTLLSLLLALLRMLVRRRSALPGLGLAMGSAVAAVALLLLHQGALEALDLVAASRPIMRRAMLQAALEEAVAPGPVMAAMALLASTPHALLSWRERPVRGRWIARLLGGLALILCGASVARSWTVLALLQELSPALEQLDATPGGVFTLLDAESRGPLTTALTLDLVALGLSGLAAATSLGVGGWALVRPPRPQNNAA